MDERPSIPVIRYDTARVPDDRPGAGEQAAERFWDVRTEVLDLCRKYGPVGPDDDDVGYEDFAFWVVADQYNYERYQYVEICQPAGMTEDWLLDLAALLRAKWPYWGVGVSNVPLGYLIAFGDRLMVTGPTFESCTTITDVVARAWEGLTLQAMIRSCRSDGDLERLLQVPGVDELPLALRKLEQVTDVGLSFVARLREIRNLDLGKSHITNQGLAGLGPLRKLETLSLEETGAGDAGLICLQGTPRLKTLYLRGCRVTDTGLRYVAALKELEDLYLSHTPITDAGLVHLGALSALRRLYLEGCRITDDGLPHLGKLTRLEGLDLAATKVSDAGLVHLSGLRHLEFVDLKGTRVTSAGAKALQRALPNCDITFNGQ